MSPQSDSLCRFSVSLIIHITWAFILTASAFVVESAYSRSKTLRLYLPREDPKVSRVILAQPFFKSLMMISILDDESETTVYENKVRGI